MFGPNVADKYLPIATKELDFECNSQPCCPGHFLIANPSSWYDLFHSPSGTLVIYYRLVG